MLLTTKKEFGQRTFFRNKENNITIEHWGGGYVGYAFNYGVVYKNSLIINSYKPRDFLSAKQNLPTPNKYVFIELGLSDNADW